MNSEFSAKAALVLIDAQKGFHDPYWGKRNNPEAEQNIKALLRFFRESKRGVVHIQHLSTESQSPLRPHQPGVEFLEGLEPLPGEAVFQKNVNSAFLGTGLEAHLRAQGFTLLLLVGFTTDHCVSSTARMAANLGFQVLLCAEATVAFDRIGTEGNTFPAELVHQVSLASLRNEFATVLSRRQLEHLFD